MFHRRNDGQSAHRWLGMAQRAPKKTPAELHEERRQARWKAFWNPIITLTSIVTSVGMLMFFLRTCRERLPQFSPPGTVAPVKNQPATVTPGRDSSPTSPGKSAVTQDRQSAKDVKDEGRTPAQ